MCFVDSVLTLIKAIISFRKKELSLDKYANLGLDNNINIIQDDIYNYNTSDLYDLIIIDIIWNSNEMTEVQYQSLETKFLNNLNTGGALYTPVKEKWVIK